MEAEFLCSTRATFPWQPVGMSLSTELTDRGAAARPGEPGDRSATGTAKPGHPTLGAGQGMLPGCPQMGTGATASRAEVASCEASTPPRCRLREPRLCQEHRVLVNSVFWITLNSQLTPCSRLNSVFWLILCSG